MCIQGTKGEFILVEGCMGPSRGIKVLITFSLPTHPLDWGPISWSMYFFCTRELDKFDNLLTPYC